MSGWWPSKVGVKGLGYRLDKKKGHFESIKFVIATHQKWGEGECEHGSLGALRAWVFGFLLIEISSRKAVPDVPSAFIGPSRHVIIKF